MDTGSQSRTKEQLISEAVAVDRCGELSMTAWLAGLNKEEAALFTDATDAALWLGVDFNIKGEEVHNRMHLDTKMAKALIAVLQEFVETGEIGRVKARRAQLTLATCRPIS